jgi:membrane protein DedA with SNARE-associated domain/rhodanese-related sulfurtransferase
MNGTSDFLIHHGLPLIFASVLVDQLGLPLPALPWLLGAGALSAAGKFNLVLGMLVTVAACLIADAIWFYLGRHRGNRVLDFVCRISLEPDWCVRRAHDIFTKYGLRGVLVAKFVPGMSTVVSPLAGMSKVSLGQFLLVDAAGSALYAGCIFGIGYFFSSQIDQIARAISHIGVSALSLVAVVVVIFIAYKYWQRRRLLNALRVARITVTELREMLEAGKAPVILDLRSSAALEEDLAMIEGAIHLRLDEVDARLEQFPKDGDIIVYCASPNEVSSARLALHLQRKGFTRARPLLGGINAWRNQNYLTSTQKNLVTVQIVDQVGQGSVKAIESNRSSPGTEQI